MNHNLDSSLSMLPLYFLSKVDNTIHFVRQNYEIDHIANVRGKTCSCGKPWQMDVNGNRK